MSAFLWKQVCGLAASPESGGAQCFVEKRNVRQRGPTTGRHAGHMDSGFIDKSNTSCGRMYSPSGTSSESQTIERVQANMNEQPEREQTCPAWDRQHHISKDGRLGMQRVEVDAAAIRVVHWLSQQMIHVDKPTREKPQPSSQEATAIPNRGHGRGYSGVQQQM